MTELDVAQLRQAVIDGAVQTAVVMLLVATSALLGTYLTEVQAPQQLAQGRLLFLLARQRRHLLLIRLALPVRLVPGHFSGCSSKSRRQVGRRRSHEHPFRMVTMFSY